MHPLRTTLSIDNSCFNVLSLKYYICTNVAAELNQILYVEYTNAKPKFRLNFLKNVLAFTDEYYINTASSSCCLKGKFSVAPEP
jgi:hypothetical protein